MAVSAVEAGTRVTGAHSLREGAVVAGRAGGRVSGLVVVEGDQWGPGSGFLVVAGFADVAGLESNQVFADLAFGTQEGAGVAGDAQVDEAAVVGVDGGPIGDAAVAGVAGGGCGDVVGGFAGLSQRSTVARGAGGGRLDLSVIKRKCWLPRRRENIVARIAIVGSVQSLAMFTGFAASGNTVTVRAIFHEPGVVDRCSKKRSGALVAHAAIRRRNHVTKILSFRLNPIMTGCTSTQCLSVKSGQISGDVGFFPIRKAATSCTRVANLANAG